MQYAGPQAFITLEEQHYYYTGVEWRWSIIWGGYERRGTATSLGQANRYIRRTLKQMKKAGKKIA